MFTINILLSLGAWYLFRYNKVTIEMLDMNQANSTLISYRNKHVVVDCGSDLSAIHPYYYLSTLLAERSIKKIDALIITHPDLDHIGQLSYLMKTVDIKSIYLPIPRTKTDTTKLPDFFSFVKRTDSIKLTKNFKILFFHPVDSIFSGTKNDRSLVFKIYVKGKTLLFTGDIGSKVMHTIQKIAPIKADILIYPHHGSKYSISPEFLDCVAPDQIIISAGFNNRYHHPSVEVLNDLKRMNYSVHITASAGRYQMAF
ncbi:MAG: hypothetical protein Kow00108_04420 [Calditrichia bacterium]